MKLLMSSKFLWRTKLRVVLDVPVLILNLCIVAFALLKLFLSIDCHRQKYGERSKPTMLFAFGNLSDK